MLNILNLTSLSNSILKIVIFNLFLLQFVLCFYNIEFLLIYY